MKTLFGIVLLVAALFAPLSQAASCKDNRDFYQSLPTVIGREDQQGKFPYVLNCDTVFVRKGVTTTVHPGTLIHFAKPTLYSVIKVEGTLVLKGTKGSHVRLSGNLDTIMGSPEPGNKTWGGIEVGEEGRLVIEYTGFLGAPTPITAFSRQVKIQNAWFKGSSGIILPDGTLYPMDSKWHAINNLDLAKGGQDRKPVVMGRGRPSEAISEAEKAALLAKKSEGFWTWPKVAGGLAALAVVGVGAFYLVPEPTESAQPQPQTEKKVTLPDAESILRGLKEIPPQ